MIDNRGNHGVLLVLSGPTGSGKDALITELKKTYPAMHCVITTTTRAMRESESEGYPYHFITRTEFEQKIARGEFFEWVEFRNALYGTERAAFEKELSTGADCVWKIETQGVKHVRENIKATYKHAVFIFVTAKELETLHKRVLADSGNNTHRWNESLVRWEMEQTHDFDYVVFNEDGNLDTAVLEVRAIIEETRKKAD